MQPALYSLSMALFQEIMDKLRSERSIFSKGERAFEKAFKNALKEKIDLIQRLRSTNVDLTLLKESIYYQKAKSTCAYAFRFMLNEKERLDYFFSQKKYDLSARKLQNILDAILPIIEELDAEDSTKLYVSRAKQFDSLNREFKALYKKTPVVIENKLQALYESVLSSGSSKNNRLKTQQATKSMPLVNSNDEMNRGSSSSASQGLSSTLYSIRDFFTPVENGRISRLFVCNELFQSMPILAWFSCCCVISREDAELNSRPSESVAGEGIPFADSFSYRFNSLNNLQNPLRGSARPPREMSIVSADNNASQLSLSL